MEVAPVDRVHKGATTHAATHGSLGAPPIGQGTDEPRPPDPRVAGRTTRGL